MARDVDGEAGRLLVRNMLEIWIMMLGSKRRDAEAPVDAALDESWLRLGPSQSSESSVLVRWAKFLFQKPDRAAAAGGGHEGLSLQDEGVRAFVDEMVYRTRRYQRPLSIVLLDVRQAGAPLAFKTVFGRLSSKLRRLDVCLRLDSEGLLLILCPELDSDGAGEFAGRLNVLIDELADPDGGVTEVRSATATLPGSATTFDGLLNVARQGLHPLGAEAV